ncbi:hypothetical protein MJO28_008798 [Puccinia striiformis f. sp. tritici]|uniref:Uncharacterized protein n=1 Tax=Puccinia striiformis f. sp. tritici TaxID=168172 RepID=A0ACC0EDR6_9BASI|nr:hypothetical protein MJO28_008798 [Puccinia striiformis f. sp. tritici]
MPPKYTQAQPSQSTRPKPDLTRKSTRPKLDVSKTKRPSRFNPYRHETLGQRALREKNDARLERSLQRIEVLHRGEIPMPSSSRALEAHLRSQQELSGQEETSEQVEESNQPTQSQLWDNYWSGCMKAEQKIVELLVTVIRVIKLFMDRSSYDLTELMC